MKSGFWWLGWLLGGLPVAVCAAPASPVQGVVVQVEPPVIIRRTFDPARPPSDMPKLTPPEVGTCVYSFGCTTEIEIRGMPGHPARVTAVQVHPRLTITLWTPRDGPAKILAHEEAHRAISEVYYGPAESVARQLAQRELGRTLIAAASDRRAIDAELRAIQDRLIAAFLRQTATRCDFAQARFDAITEHSMNPIPEGVAIAQALAEERQAYARGNGEKPPSVPSTAGSAGTAVRRAPTRPVAR